MPLIYPSQLLFMDDGFIKTASLMETITLIQTELQLPRLTSDLLERPSLIQRLINGLNCKLILVATLFSKMQVANRAEAIVDAREAGLGQSDWLNLRKN